MCVCSTYFSFTPWMMCCFNVLSFTAFFSAAITRRRSVIYIYIYIGCITGSAASYYKHSSSWWQLIVLFFLFESCLSLSKAVCVMVKMDLLHKLCCILVSKYRHLSSLTPRDFLKTLKNKGEKGISISISCKVVLKECCMSECYAYT